MEWKKWDKGGKGRRGERRDRRGKGSGDLWRRPCAWMMSFKRSSLACQIADCEMNWHIFFSRGLGVEMSRHAVSYSSIRPNNAIVREAEWQRTRVGPVRGESAAEGGVKTGDNGVCMMDRRSFSTWYSAARPPLCSPRYNANLFFFFFEKRSTLECAGANQIARHWSFSPRG